jgi:hypothetical protein
VDDAVYHGLGVPFTRASVLAMARDQKTQSRRVVTRLRVRVRHIITSDLPVPGLPIRIAKPGRYRASLGAAGAVVAQTSMGPLGLKPGEFDFVCPWISDGVTHLANHGGGKTCWTVIPSAGAARVRVLEKWRTYERPADLVDGILFEADGAFVPIENTPEAAERWVDAHKNGIHRDKWRSPWFMPRWAARTDLAVFQARLVHLKDIGDEDAAAEGARHWPDIPDPHPYGDGARWSFGEPASTDECLGTARFAFANHWDQINGTRAPWADNPWVWAYTFARAARAV